MNIFKIDKKENRVVVLQEQNEKQPEILLLKNAWLDGGFNVYGNACILRENEIISLKEYDKNKIIITKYGISFYVIDEIEVDIRDFIETKKEGITQKMVLALKKQAYQNEQTSLK